MHSSPHVASPPARPVMGVRHPPARKFPNLLAARTVRAIEVLAFHPASAPALAATLGVSSPHARRLLLTLEDEGYLQRGHGSQRQQHTYSLTPRLLALAGQLAARHPLVTQAEPAVRELRESTGLDAHLVIPSYGDVIVLATTGGDAPARWSLQPATASAGGHVLLAYRHSWRDDQRPADHGTAQADLETRAAKVRDDGYALHAQDNLESLAVPVPMEPAPIAALALSSQAPNLRSAAHDGMLRTLRRAAERIDADRHEGRLPTAG